MAWGFGYGRPFESMIRPRWRPGCRRYKGTRFEFVRWILADSRALDGWMYHKAVKLQLSAAAAGEPDLNPFGCYLVS